MTDKPKHDDGGAAYPGGISTCPGCGSQVWPLENKRGATLLDYFAAGVLRGLIQVVDPKASDALVAEAAYDLAAAMIAEKRRREHEE